MIGQGLFDAIGSAAGLDDLASLRSPGVSIVGDEGRTGRASTYRHGDHLVVWCGRDIEAELGPVEQPDMVDALLGALLDPSGTGWEFVPGRRPTSFDDSGWRSLDPIDDRAAIVDLLDDCDPDEVDEAEFDLDDLDPHLIGAVRNGELLGIAGARPWSARPGYGDIGILVRPSARRQGVATRLVTNITAHLAATGLEPLYRCNTENAGSNATARRAGFVEAVFVTAYRR